MYPGSPPSSAPGETRDMYLELSGAYIAGQAICTLKPWDWYRERWWTFFIGGKWCGQNFYVPASGDLTIALPIDPNTDLAAIWAQEVGDWDSFAPEDIPDAEALIEEAHDANTFVVRWKAQYSLSAVEGDSQLSSITIAGARRGRNVEEVPYFPQRGRLTYSIFSSNDLTTKIIRWYAGNRLVAEGTATTSPQAITCTPKNGSGMTVTATFTYSTDIAPGVALIDIKWPKSYQIHYSTSALSYPRTPEATRDDNGNDEYFYRIGVPLPVGNYNYNVLQVDDEGDVQTSVTAPADSPKAITPGPIGPTITGIDEGRVPTLVASDSAVEASGTSLTLPYTIAAGDNRVLIVAIKRAAAFTSLTYGGSALTLLTSVTEGSQTLALYYLIAPAVGTANIVLTAGGVGNLVLLAADYINVDQTTPLENADSDSSASASTLNIPEPANANNDIAIYAGLARSLTTPPTLAQGGDTLVESLAAESGLSVTLLATHEYSGGNLEINNTASASLLAIAGGNLKSIDSGSSGLIIRWDIGEAGCTYKAYSSGINEPVNLGQRATPAPVGPTATDATSASLGAVTGAAATDVTSDYATLTAAYDLAVGVLANAFVAGESGWLTALETFETSIDAAIDAWAAAIGKELEDAKEQIGVQLSMLVNAENSVADQSLSATEWQDFTGTYFSGLLLFLGALLEGESGRYVFKSGILPGASPAGTGTITGNAPDGSAGVTGMEITQSLKAAGEPFVKYGFRRFIVRATKSGVEERNDVPFVLEINGSNAPQFPRPPLAQINRMYYDAGDLVVTVIVKTTDAAAAPVYVDLYVVAVGATPTFASPDVSGTLGADLGGYKQVTVRYTFPGADWYDVIAVARSAAGQRSVSYSPKTIEYSGGTVPGGVESISANVQRNQGIRPEES